MDGMRYFLWAAFVAVLGLVTAVTILPGVQ